MKNYLFTILGLLLFLRCNAQDIIVKKDGSPIMAKITKIGTNEVEYKKWSNKNGPIYAIAKNDIFAITYQNGEKEMFDNVSIRNEIKTNSNSANGYIKPVPASNNLNLIKLYDQYVTPTSKIKTSNKESKNHIYLFAISPKSILSTDDVEVSFIRTLKQMPSNDYEYVVRYFINFKNKTDEIIYFDKANCFRTSTKSSAHSYYNSTQITSSNNHNFTVGGVLPIPLPIGLSVGTTSGTASTMSVNRIVAIPPHSTANLVEERYVITRGKTIIHEDRAFKWIEALDNFDDLFDKLYGLKSLNVKQGEIRSFTEEQSPFFYKFHFTYSKKSDFSEFSSLSAEWYIKEIIGTGSIDDDSSYGPEKYLNGLNSHSLIAYNLWLHHAK